MKKIIRLTESDLIRLVKRVISEQPEIVSKTASKIDESRGVEVEFNGSLFAHNVKQKNFNEQSEIKAILNQQPTTEQKAMFKKQIDSCFSKYPKIKNMD